jgi:hypothetical protein
MGIPLNTRTMSRIINIKTVKVIKALKENKKTHIAEYEKAKEAYKLEGLEQAAKIIKDFKDGKNGLQLNLMTELSSLMIISQCSRLKLKMKLNLKQMSLITTFLISRGIGRVYLIELTLLSLDYKK